MICEVRPGPRKITSVSGPRNFGPPFSGDKKASSDRKVKAKMKEELVIWSVYESVQDRDKGAFFY